MSDRSVASASSRFRALPLQPLFDAAFRFWQEHDLLTDLQDGPGLLGRARTVVETCDALRIESLGRLIERRDEVLARLATPAPHEVRVRPERRFGLHNLLCALVAGGLQAEDHDATFAMEVLAAGVQDDSPSPRPLRDDEILLLRLRSVLAFLTWDRQPLFAIQYALTEAGARPSETTVVVPEDFDDPRAPSQVCLPGVENGVAAPRMVTLPQWARPFLAACLDRHLAVSRHAHVMPVAYSGRHACGGHQASAAASTTLKRAIRQAGITGPLPRATGIVKWRVAKELHDRSVHHAMALMGGRSLDKVYAFTEERPMVVAPGGSLETYLGL